MKNLTAILSLLLGLLVSPAGLMGENQYLIHLTGPSLTKHFGPYHDQFNDFHLGLGVEAYYRKNHWLFGCNGHFMFNDSNGRTAYWIGIVPGYFVGNQKKLWGSLAVIVGGIKKNEYNEGRFSFFGLPYITVGYGRIGLNAGYIPKIVNVTYPILIFQLKILVYPFPG
jgi:hypothetical protein